MNILITGGAGYIGSVVTEHFVEKHRVVIFDDLSTGMEMLINKDAIFIKGSILDKAKLEQIFKKYHFDIVFHFAAKTVVPESVLKPKLYFNVNNNGTKNILSCMKKYCCEKIIFASTAAVYGEPKNSLIKENDTKHPCNPYGASKLEAEKKIILTKNIKYVIYRFFNVAGASDSLLCGMAKDKPTLLIPKLNQAILNHETPCIFGNQYKTKDGTCLRDYIHVKDIAYAFDLAIPFLSKGKSGIFNLGCNSGYTVLDIVKKVCKHNKVKPHYKLKPPRLGDPAILVASITKAIKELKWKPKCSLDEMIISDIEFRKRYKYLLF